MNAKTSYVMTEEGTRQIIPPCQEFLDVVVFL